MLLPLLFAAAATTAQADTLLAPGVVLLGEYIDVPTFVREDPLPAPQRPSLASYVSMPFPQAEFPGMPGHGLELPTQFGFTRTELERAIASVESEVNRGSFPGAALAIGRWDRTVVERGVGTLDRGFASPNVDPDHTLYDLASLTKVVAATTAVMILVEDGKMELDAPVSRYLREFSGGEKDWVTIRHLLAHSSGLPAGAQIAAPSPQLALQRALAVPLKTRPGQSVEYSDVGFVVLWAAAERAHGAPLHLLLHERVFDPLEMWMTTFNPGAACFRCAPTDPRPGYQGVVHDPMARHLGGITGNAGLFSTVHDLARFASMLANGGELEGRRVLQRSTVELFTRRQPGAGTRALGWDTPDARGAGAAGLQISRNAFGHTGFTGTSMWIDPARGTWVVLLSNRTMQPAGPNRMQAIRRQINDYVATAIDLGPRVDR
jgi:serine-type D-Ala-D-Ala carboxypeptidase